MQEALSKIEGLRSEIQSWIEHLNAKYAGKTVACPSGRYKGKPAKVALFSFDLHSGLTVLLKPINTRTGALISNHSADSRTFWPVENIDFDNDSK